MDGGQRSGGMPAGWEPGLPLAEPHCRRWVLAREGCAQVAVCSCGSVHVTVGGATVRLPVAALGPLHGLLGTAVERLAQARRGGN